MRKSQAVDGLEEAEIVEIIDHHRLGNIETIVTGIFPESAGRLYGNDYLSDVSERKKSPFRRRLQVFSVQRLFPIHCCSVHRPAHPWMRRRQRSLQRSPESIWKSLRKKCLMQVAA